MFGYSEREALGKPMSIIGTPERINEFESIIKQIKQGKNVERYETAVKKRWQCYRSDGYGIARSR